MTRHYLTTDEHGPGQVLRSVKLDGAVAWLVSCAAGRRFVRPWEVRWHFEINLN